MNEQIQIAIYPSSIIAGALGAIVGGAISYAWGLRVGRSEATAQRWLPKPTTPFPVLKRPEPPPDENPGRATRG